MSDNSLVTRLQAALTVAPPLGAVVVLDVSDRSPLTLDGSGSQNQVREEDDSAAVTRLTLSADTLSGLIDGVIDPTMAFMTGKLKVKGKMGYAMKLASLLED